jgi:hypothetical protein
MNPTGPAVGGQVVMEEAEAAVAVVVTAAVAVDLMVVWEAAAVRHQPWHDARLGFLRRRRL